jgi:hypothetical protein
MSRARKHDDTNRSSRKWLKGCGIGCGVVVLLVVLALVGGSFVIIGPFRRDVDVRETLDERYGGVNEFVPWVDGGIPASRVEAFLEVRRSIRDNCAKMGSLDDGSAAIERLDTEEDPNPVVVMGESMKSVFGMGASRGDFYLARNSALLEAEMSLGEYTYIYTLVYGPTIAGASEDVYLTRRVRETLRQQLRHRLTAMEDQLDVWGDTEERGLLEDQIAVLEADPDRLPWQTTRPPSLQAALSGYEHQLEALYCAGVSEHELTLNRIGFGGTGVMSE